MSNQDEEVQIIENETDAKIRLGGYLQLLLTAFIAWLFFNSIYHQGKYSLHDIGISVYRLNEATGQADRYDSDANGWVQIRDSGMAYIVQTNSASQ